MRSFQALDVPFRTQQFVVFSAQAGSFHQAARQLGIHTSLITRSIDQLERNLGVRIFNRNRHSFSVTPAGKLFILEIKEAVLHVQRACDLVHYENQIERGHFRLGYSGYIHSKIIPTLETMNPAAQPNHPSTLENRITPILAESGITLHSDTTPKLVEGVLRGQFQAAFGIMPLYEKDLCTQQVVHEPFCLCISKNHPLAKRSSLLVKDLNHEIVFFVPRSMHPHFYDRTIEYIESTGTQPILREVLSFVHATEIAARNLGVALLPSSASQLSRMEVLFKPIADKLFSIETALFHRKNLENEKTQFLLDKLLAKVKQKTAHV